MRISDLRNVADRFLVRFVPLIDVSSYRAPWYLPNAHWQTVFPNVTRRRLRVEYRRERVELPDSDFLDIDWIRRDGMPTASNCCLILHGLEGDSRAPYVKSMGIAFSKSGYEVGALNLRGCSGEPNRLKRFYHSGDTEGLAFVLETISKRYERISMIGFSLGGNVVLKYMGEAPSRIPASVSSVVAFSVPCELEASADCLSEPRNSFYMKRFIKLLGQKLKDKQKVYPQFRYPGDPFGMESFHQFDGAYTAPLNGFRDARDYWDQSSCIRYLKTIDRPALLVSARNDPFLSESCFPVEISQSSPFLYLEIPDAGGHCGFPGGRTSDGYWHEGRALSFFKEMEKTKVS